jgi:hypothetical protein
MLSTDTHRIQHPRRHRHGAHKDRRCRMALFDGGGEAAQQGEHGDLGRAGDDGPLEHFKQVVGEVDGGGHGQGKADAGPGQRDGGGGVVLADEFKLVIGCHAHVHRQKCAQQEQGGHKVLEEGEKGLHGGVHSKKWGTNWLMLVVTGRVSSRRHMPAAWSPTVHEPMTG